MQKQKKEKILSRLAVIYDEANSLIIFNGLEKTFDKFMQRKKLLKEFSEKDIFLISYADSIYKKGEAPIKTLHTFAKKNFIGVINNVHILPFFPYSSDFGFSVKDYKKVNDKFGSWKDIECFGNDFNMMFDYVINHISSESKWFQAFLSGSKKYSKFFIEQEWCDELSLVTRPRSLPLLNDFEMKDGMKSVWTTFSRDQIDLNFSNTEVFVEMTKVLLFYASKGASVIRLDAIGFLWKEVGTSCMHHKNTHKIIQAWREILGCLNFNTKLIAEVNETHYENMQYMGSIKNKEANMVYEFALGSLALYAIRNGKSKCLNQFAKLIGDTKTAKDFTFVNVLSTHDGIGLNSLKGFLTDKERRKFIKGLHRENHLFGYKNIAGKAVEYELNSTYIDALADVKDSEQDRLKKLCLAHFVLFSSKGVPFIYINNLLGGDNNYAGIEKIHENRAINREKFLLSKLEKDFAVEGSQKRIVFDEISKLVKLRKTEFAFNPMGSVQKVLDVHKSIFAMERGSGKNLITIVANLSNKPIRISLDCEEYFDIISGRDISTDKRGKFVVEPYQYLWLK